MAERILRFVCEERRCGPACTVLACEILYGKYRKAGVMAELGKVIAPAFLHELNKIHYRNSIVWFGSFQNQAAVLPTMSVPSAVKSISGT